MSAVNMSGVSEVAFVDSVSQQHNCDQILGPGAVFSYRRPHRGRALAARL